MGMMKLASLTNNNIYQRILAPMFLFKQGVPSAAQPVKFFFKCPVASIFFFNIQLSPSHCIFQH